MPASIFAMLDEKEEEEEEGKDTYSWTFSSLLEVDPQFLCYYVNVNVHNLKYPNFGTKFAAKEKSGEYRRRFSICSKTQPSFKAYSCDKKYFEIHRVATMSIYESVLVKL